MSGCSAGPRWYADGVHQTTGTVRQTLNLWRQSYAVVPGGPGFAARAADQGEMDGIQIGSLVSANEHELHCIHHSVLGGHQWCSTLAFTGTDPANRTTFIDAVTVQ